MAVNFTSKNTLGIVISLFLVILLSQAKTFNFLIDTVLGRFFLVLFILTAGYVSKILGVVLVLFIIIAVNQSTAHYNDYNFGYGYIEGFTGPSGETIDASNIAMDCTDVSSCQLVIQQLSSENTNLKNQLSQSETTTDTTESFTSIEGFNITERESSILKGKRSNEIPIFSNARNQSNNISPTNSDVFLSNYGKIQ